MGNDHSTAAPVPTPKIIPQAVGDIDIKQEAPKKEEPNQEPALKKEERKQEPAKTASAPKKEEPKERTFNDILNDTIHAIREIGKLIYGDIGLVFPPGDYREKMDDAKENKQRREIVNELPYCLMVYVVNGAALTNNLKTYWHFAFESRNMRGTSLAFYLVINPDKKSSSFKFKGDFKDALEQLTKNNPVYAKMGNWQNLVVNPETTKTMYLQYIMPKFNDNTSQYNAHKKALKTYMKGKLDEDYVSTIKYSDPAHTVFDMFCNNADSNKKSKCETRNTCEVADKYDDFFEIIELTITPIEKEGFCGCMHAGSHPCITVVLAIIIVIGLIYVLFNLCDCPFSLDSFSSTTDFSYRY